MTQNINPIIPASTVIDGTNGAKVAVSDHDDVRKSFFGLAGAVNSAIAQVAGGVQEVDLSRISQYQIDAKNPASIYSVVKGGGTLVLPKITKALSGYSCTMQLTGADVSVTRIKGTIDGVTDWSLDSPNNWLTIWCDGIYWHACGGMSSGVNSNGAWIKWSDGTLECRKTAITGTRVVFNASFDGYTWNFVKANNVNHNFPVAFIAIPEIVSSGGDNDMPSCATALDTTSYRVTGIDYGGVGSTYLVDMIAKGRWK